MILAYIGYLRPRKIHPRPKNVEKVLKYQKQMFAFLFRPPKNFKYW
jgi:hypothetical protein